MMTIPNVEVTNWGSRTILWVDSDYIDECMSYYRENDLDGIGISPHKGYKNSTVEFLRDHAYVKGVVLSDAKKIDIGPIQDLKNLVFVSVSDSLQGIDFSRFPKLEEIRIEWNPKMRLTVACRALRTVYLRRYRPKSKCLSSLPELPALMDLAIVQSPIVSISGIGKFRNLKRLELAYLTKLENISAIEELMNTSIEMLDFLKCRKISDHDAVKCLASLKTLKFNDCGEIPNIRFLNEMCNLEEFRFVNTNVLDGDLSPLLKLKAVGFFAKKHYSHSPEDIDARIGC